MSRRQYRTLDKGRKTLLLHDGVSLVLKKSRSTECFTQVLCHATGLRASERTGKLLLQVEFCMSPVEKPKAGYQQWGNNELSVRIAKAIANKQAGPVSDWRKVDVQVCSKPRQDHS